MQSDYFKTWVEIDPKALVHNYSAYKKAVGKDVTVVAVVKSNAYGHGIAEVAESLLNDKTFQKNGWFAVDSITEAMTLRRQGVKLPILILGYVPKPLLAEIVKNDFRVSLYDLDVLHELAMSAQKYKKKAFVHIKIETGTYRQGIVFDDIPKFVESLKKHKGYIEVEGIYSHFADSENTASLYYKTQLSRLEQAIGAFRGSGIVPKFTHISSSAGGFLYPEARKSMARLGVSLFGLYPSLDVEKHVKVSLKPVLTWKTRVVQLKDISDGETIGYVRSYTASRPMKIAVLPIGYWDGYDRHLSNKGFVLIKGKRAPIVGKICMNICMVDVTDVPEVKVGDEVVLLGKQSKEQVTADEIAGIIGTIHYEVVTRINPLIPRILNSN